MTEETAYDRFSRQCNVRHNAAKYRQISKYCERCRAATPHQVREQEGIVAKICVVCLLRGYLSGNQGASENGGQSAGRVMK